MSYGRMPLTSHKKGSRDGGSAQSSPVRSTENLTQETHLPVHGRTSQPILETNVRGQVGVSSVHSGEEKATVSRSTTWEAPSSSERAMNSGSHYHKPHHQHHGFGWGDKEKVILSVDGKRFSINPNLLVKHPNTMLGRSVQHH